ncbi:MAG: helix-turn-helix domain-containing protein [Pseudonocardiales bacterium]
MATQLYSVEQVANLLGLHVKTVRNYVRDGHLKAVRIGKQYRIASEDLEAFTGRPAPAPAGETARRRRHVEVSSIVQIDAISPAAMSRLSTMIMSSVQGRDDDERLRIETVYHEERASMKIILLGGVDTTAELLKIISTLLEDEP